MRTIPLLFNCPTFVLWSNTLAVVIVKGFQLDLHSDSIGCCLLAFATSDLFPSLFAVYLYLTERRKIFLTSASFRASRKLVFLMSCVWVGQSLAPNLDRNRRQT